MKRRDLIRRLRDMGCVFIRHGGKHDWYQNKPDNSLNRKTLGGTTPNFTPALNCTDDGGFLYIFITFRRN